MFNVCLDCTGASGLHVHPSPKGLQNVSQNRRFFVKFYSLSPGGAKLSPRGTQGVRQECPRGVQRGQMGTQGMPKLSKCKHRSLTLRYSRPTLGEIPRNMQNSISNPATVPVPTAKCIELRRGSNTESSGSSSLRLGGKTYGGNP